jgi:hypothetical protein
MIKEAANRPPLLFLKTGAGTISSLLSKAGARDTRSVPDISVETA